MVSSARLHFTDEGAPAPVSLRGRLGGIDQLRGLAILLVLIYHAGPLSWRLASYQPSGWIAWPQLPIIGWLAVPWLHFGYTGVHAFFVLSGLCIHLRAAGASATGRPTSLSPRIFFLKRFWRIYPPYWVALGLFGVALPVALRWIGATAGPPPATLKDLLLHASMLHTFDRATFFSINPAFWSLATEEQFYLAYPLALAGIRRFGAGRVVLAALVISLVWRSVVLMVLPPTGEHFMAYRVLVHGFFVPRWFEWLLGCWLAEALARGSRLQPHPRLLLAAAVFLLLSAMASRVHVALDKLLSDELFGAGYCALILGVLAVRPLTRWRPVALMGAALHWLGRRAYGYYLVHQPFLDGRALPLLLRAVMAGGAGAIFSRLCERPFERRSQQLSAPSRSVTEV